MLEFNFQKDSPLLCPMKGNGGRHLAINPGRSLKAPIRNLRGNPETRTQQAQQRSHGRHDFQWDPDPRRGEERPSCPHGIPPADARTGAQPWDQVHKGAFFSAHFFTRTFPPFPLYAARMETPRRELRRNLSKLLWVWVWVHTPGHRFNPKQKSLSL